MSDSAQTTRFEHRAPPVTGTKVVEVAIRVPLTTKLLATKLLISVRDASEAEIVRSAGADWIDLKEPRAGPLGQPSLTVAREVASVLSNHSQRSVALGEFRDLDFELAGSLAELFPVVKVGLSGLQDVAWRNWRSGFEELGMKVCERGAQLVPVVYADAVVCNAPNAQEVLVLAERLKSRYLLIDTFVKDGRRLLDWLSLEELQKIAATARGFECQLVLAGSLQFADIPLLQPLLPAALAVRGAVCESASRASAIAAAKVAQWVTALHSSLPDS